MKNTLYLKAPGNWINDPNGFIYYKGEYHLFYQYFPYAPHWGRMHWGHAVSPDLIHWTHQGVALYPSKPFDMDGVFSGSAIEVDGKMRLYYTGVRYLEVNEEDINVPTAAGGVPCQAMIESDGVFFDNVHGKRVVVPTSEDPAVIDTYECRDPKVWKEEDTYYMCLGSTREKKRGVLLVLESKDGIHWEINQRIEDESLGYILECPDLFQVDGQYVLVSSPMGVKKGEDCYEHQATVRFAEFDGKNRRLSLDDKIDFLDYGLDLYAPQSNVDEDGRRVVISWLRMPMAEGAASNPASNGKPWNGMMALPRVVSISEGKVYTSVHPKVREFFTEGNVKGVGHGAYQEAIREGFHQIRATLTEGQEIDLYGYKISLKNGKVRTDRSAVIPEDVKLHRICESPVVGEACELEIYMEQNIVEVYINGGQHVITNWIHEPKF